VTEGRARAVDGLVQLMREKRIWFLMALVVLGFILQLVGSVMVSGSLSWGDIKDYQTVLSAFAVIFAAFIGFISAHLLESRKVDQEVLALERRRLAFVTAESVAASFIEVQARLKMSVLANGNFRAMRIDCPKIFSSGWEDFGLLSHRQQNEIFRLTHTIKKFNALIAEERKRPNQKNVEGILDSIASMSGFVADSARKRSETIRAMPDMVEEAKRSGEDTKLFLHKAFNIDKLQAQLESAGAAD
jgi:hypothetical protein